MPIDILEIETENATQSARLRQFIVRELNKKKIHHHWSNQASKRSQNRAKPFDFSTRVTIISTRKATLSLHEKTGTIMGRAPGLDGWIYTVFIDDQGECWSLSHDELKPISKPIAKHAPHPVRHIRVRVDKKGRGYAV